MADPSIPAPPNGQPVQAQVSFGTVSALPPAPASATLTTPRPPYLGFGQTVAYEWDDGYAPMPTAGPAGSRTAIPRVHGGTCVKVVTTVATRVGAKVQMPVPRSQSTNEVRIRRRHVNFTPGKLPDGTQIHGAISQVVFQLQVPPSDTDSLDMGTSPFDTTPAAVNVLNPADFSSWLLGTPAPVGGGVAIEAVNY